MRQHPLVSICIPTYNGEAFIMEAIASGLTQTYGSIEIIISDDNSEDNTLSIVQSLKDQVSVNLSIYHHHNLGIVIFVFSKLKVNILNSYFKMIFSCPTVLKKW